MFVYCPSDASLNLTSSLRGPLASRKRGRGAGPPFFLAPPRLQVRGPAEHWCCALQQELQQQAQSPCKEHSTGTPQEASPPPERAPMVENRRLAAMSRSSSPVAKGPWLRSVCRLWTGRGLVEQPRAVFFYHFKSFAFCPRGLNSCKPRMRRKDLLSAAALCFRSLGQTGAQPRSAQGAFESSPPLCGQVGMRTGGAGGLKRGAFRCQDMANAEPRRGLGPCACGLGRPKIGTLGCLTPRLLGPSPKAVRLRHHSEVPKEELLPLSALPIWVGPAILEELHLEDLVAADGEDVASIQEAEADASFCAAHGRYVEAAEYLEQAISVRQTLLGDDHEVTWRV